MATKKPVQPSLGGEFEAEESKNDQPVDCLGMTFPNDEARRKYFLEKLREKLKDPEFKKIEGFPIGSDEDIIALSDPPYYTACPNPFLEAFIKFYGKPYNPKETYNKEPFATDVSEGKNDPIYNAHSYHTKVPHKAIMRYILHYTEPGDVVFDGFCGTGMTGVAAQMCADRGVVESLGYRVQNDETILDDSGKPFSKLGVRKVVLNDLSPAATFISYNYNTAVAPKAFEKEAQRILEEVEQECGWMYETVHVEPASSRLSNKLGFKKPESSSLPTSVKEPGISEFTARNDNLPHWQLPGAFYFLTFNTKNRRILSQTSRTIVSDALNFWHGKRLQLITAVVMPDHVHAVIQPLEKEPGTFWDLADLLHSIKSFSSNEINKCDGKKGVAVWQTETYDRIIRDERELGFVLQYIALNPVKEELCSKPEEYEWLHFGELLKKAGWKPAPQGRINYTVWSDVFVCPECAKEVIFWEAAVNKEVGEVRDEFPCLHCHTLLTKRKMERAFVTKFDKALNQSIRQAKQVPVLINYSVGPAGSQPHRFEKTPDDFDLELIEKIEKTDIPYWFPTNRMPDGDESRRNDDSGLTHVHHFYTKRNLWVFSAFFHKIFDPLILCALLGCYTVGLKTARFLPQRWINRDRGPMEPHTSGTLYVPSLFGEQSWVNIFESRINACIRSKRSNSFSPIWLLSTCSATTNQAQCDYIFTDPPFGGNLMYSELNFLWEAWLKVFTNNKPEAIENKLQGKGLLEYQQLMTRCFQEYFRVLKPGRWMTVEFHNSKNSVWNAIQEALQKAGFVIADVRTLDKKQGSFKQVTSSGTVKQDLVISAYKPNGGLEERFKLEAGTEKGVWDFVQTHLKQLPVFVSKENKVEVIAERQDYLLFDRMVAFHVQRGVMVPMSASELYAGLRQRFSERDFPSEMECFSWLSKLRNTIKTA